MPSDCSASEIGVAWHVRAPPRLAAASGRARNHLHLLRDPPAPKCNHPTAKVQARMFESELYWNDQLNDCRKHGVLDGLNCSIDLVNWLVEQCDAS